MKTIIAIILVSLLAFLLAADTLFHKALKNVKLFSRIYLLSLLCTFVLLVVYVYLYA